MMRDLDSMIDEALGEEESELLRTIGNPQGRVERLFESSLGMFGAGLQWTVLLMMLIQALVFIAGVWAAWNFFDANEPVAQLRWGLPAAVLLLMSLIVKLAIAPALHHNRILRELKRIELQIARTSRRA